MADKQPTDDEIKAALPLSFVTADVENSCDRIRALFNPEPYKWKPQDDELVEVTNYVEWEKCNPRAYGVDIDDWSYYRPARGESYKNVDGKNPVPGRMVAVKRWDGEYDMDLSDELDWSRTNQGWNINEWSLLPWGVE